MNYLINLWVKIRFSSPLRILTDILGRLGIRIAPYYVYIEELDHADPPSIKMNFTGYEMTLLRPQDMKEIAEIPGLGNRTVQSFLDKLEMGHLCLGMKHDGNIAGFIWVNLTELIFCKSTIFTLKSNEAYSYDAYTLMAFRGKGIAPYIKYKLYQYLEPLGIDCLYSATLVFNTPAINFQKKLDAEIYELRLFIDIFRRWEINVRLKKYCNVDT